MPFIFIANDASVEVVTVVAIAQEGSWIWSTHW